MKPSPTAHPDTFLIPPPSYPHPDVCCFAPNSFEKLRKRRPESLRKRSWTRKKRPFFAFFRLVWRCNVLVISQKKIFSNIFATGVAAVCKKCIFAVPFCAPGERCERERMRLSRRRGEGQDGQCSLNEWKDVANNSSCSWELQAIHSIYYNEERKRPGQTNKQKKEIN